MIGIYAFNGRTTFYLPLLRVNAVRIKLYISIEGIILNPNQ